MSTFISTSEPSILPGGPAVQVGEESNTIRTNSHNGSASATYCAIMPHPVLRRPQMCCRVVPIDGSAPMPGRHPNDTEAYVRSYETLDHRPSWPWWQAMPSRPENPLPSAQQQGHRAEEEYRDYEVLPSVIILCLRLMALFRAPRVLVSDAICAFWGGKRPSIQFH